MPKPQDLSDEQVAQIAQRFGVSPEEVRKSWAGLDQLWDQGGVAAVQAALVSHVVETERDLAVIVKDAADRLHEWTGDRADGIAEYYRTVVDGTEDGEVDGEYLLLLLTVATWKLAEAQDREAALLDGGRRKGGD